MTYLDFLYFLLEGETSARAIILPVPVSLRLPSCVSGSGLPRLTLESGTLGQRDILLLKSFLEFKGLFTSPFPSRHSSVPPYLCLIPSPQR